MSAVLRWAAVGCMVMMTVTSLLHGDPWAEHNVNQGVSWFWASWALIFLSFAWTAQDDRQWIRFAYSVSLALVGLDTIRIRLDLFSGWIDPGASTVQVWAVRFVAGWATVWYLGWHRPRQIREGRTE